MLQLRCMMRFILALFLFCTCSIHGSSSISSAATTTTVTTTSKVFASNGSSDDIFNLEDSESRMMYFPVLQFLGWPALWTYMNKENREPLQNRQGRGPDLMSDCDALIRGKEGWIFTPNYPSDYGNFRTCYYVIQRYTSDTCRVEMTLNDFVLEDSPNCMADYLDVRDGQAGVLCGNLASGTKKQLQFPSGQSTITLRFKSDRQNTRKGFMIQLKQIPGSCGTTGTNFCNQYIDSFTSSITSPGYPNGYGPNLRCSYTVRKADPRICKILLEFRKLDFGRNNAWPCRGDYIEFPDLSKLCEPYPQRRELEFSRGSDLITFTFVSDGYGSGKGFDVELLQVPDSCTTVYSTITPIDKHCDQEILSITGHFTSPRFPLNYGPNERCRYTLRKVDPSVCSVELDFRAFDVEYGGPSCNKDYLTLPNLKRLCGVVSGKQLIDIPENTDSVNLYFLSDGMRQRKGFDIHVTQLFSTCNGPGPQTTCDQEISQNGRLYSPGFPGPYPPNQRCTYTIRREDPTVCQVELDFRKFDLEFSRDQCSKDFLMLPDRTRLCGTTSGIQIIKFPTGSDIIAINFFSDGFIGGRGFDITVTQRKNTCDVFPQECNTEISSIAGRITSPGFPRFYTPGLRCHYRIRRPEPSICAVELDFRTFDVATSAGCSEDYLELPDRTRLCGPQNTVRVLDYSSMGSDVMTLTFVSDSIGAGRGFDIVVRQLPNSCGIIPPPPSCDMLISEERAVVNSPNYPEDYPPNALCVYTITKSESSVCQVRLEFLDFDIEEMDDCLGDYLQLEKSGERLCGVRLPEEKVLFYERGKDALRIVFKSDATTNRRGFQARLRQMKNSCYRPVTGTGDKICGTYSEPVSYIQSENFPLLYFPNTDCQFKILRASDNICQLELFFSHFDVTSENNAMCDRDYLEIKGARYCGKRDGQRVLVDFPKSEREVLLHFKTDSFQQSSGFRIEVKQLSSGCSPVPPQSCDQTFTGKTFQIISPGYQSGSYPDNIECKYTVKKSFFKVCAIEVKFYTFDVEDSNDCVKDSLEISGMKLCGRMEYDSVRTYEFLSDEMAITFRSDSFTSGVGFFLLLTQQEC